MTNRISEEYERAVAAGELNRDDAQLAVLPALQALVDELERPRPQGLRALFSKPAAGPEGLYLWGGVGRGKSMLMNLLVGCTSAPKRRVHFHAFMQEIHDRMHEAREQGVADAVAPVADAVADEVRLLAFDELHIADIADAMIVGRLFERLLARGVKIVTTSNFAPHELYRNGLNRPLFLPFIELIESRLAVHHLASQIDYRQEVLRGATVYFSPLGPAARHGMDALWAEMTNDNARPLVLNVKGRHVELPAAFEGVARAHFWALCGQPLGPADYLAISQAVRVLFIDDVPRLSRANFNEARRFVTLIDTLYEGKVRTVISAADEPERLYIEGEGAFEFSRTASRLREMQAETWGQ